MKKLHIVLLFAVLLTIVFVSTCRVFDSTFAEATIDWFAFLAGIFLVVEGVCRFFADPAAAKHVHAFRVFRVIIGTCVFTIHLLQFMRK